MNTNKRNWFEQGGKDYATYRPQYPEEVTSYLSSIAPETKLAVDVGCGTGQLTQHLSTSFYQVVGIDPSSEQINNAFKANNINYQCSPAEKLELPDNCVDLITVAQAAHWFDLPEFYKEVSRVGKNGAVIALISYGVLRLEGELDKHFQDFYWNKIGRFWSSRRKMVDDGYKTLDFPFEELKHPAININLNWNFSEFIGYISTWSAVRNANESNNTHLFSDFASQTETLWGEVDNTNQITWDVNMRVGRV